MIGDDFSIARWSRSLLLDSLPFLTVLALIIITLLPLGTPLPMRGGGLWPLMGITYWTLVRPRSMQPVLVLIIGLLVDLVMFLPLGMHGFVFVTAQAVLKKQRRFLVGQGFWVLWAAFVLMALCAALLLAVIIEVVQQVTLPWDVLLWNVAWASAFLPLLLWALDRVHNMMDVFDEPV